MKKIYLGTLLLLGISFTCVHAQDSLVAKEKYSIIKDIDGNAYRAVTIGAQPGLPKTLK